MKYGFLSDVHGDLDALERALDCLREADRLVFLGDVLGGRHDRECLARLRAIPDLISVPGNHDLWDCELTGLPSDSQDYLRGLTVEQAVEDWLAVHSDYERGPGGEVRFPYIHSEVDARRAFDHFPQRLIFFGHTHLSQVHRLDPDGRIEFKRAPGFELAPSSRYLINVGMAAQAVVTFDSAAQRIDYHTFP
ncbi:metallophosphoesterase family protein [bacterium]|nr:metallophosphoesterase family protein [bacterium]